MTREEKKKKSETKQKKATNELKKKETHAGSKTDEKRSDGSGMKARAGKSAVRTSKVEKESEDARHGWLFFSGLTFLKV